jgi:tetratricopeptide (TPR) repeat protein
MPEALIKFVQQNQPLVVAAGIGLLLLGAAIVILVVALKRARGPRPEQAVKTTPAASAPPTGETPAEVAEPRVKRARLSVGDTPSPWTQGVYERHSPEAKFARVLPAFGFDIAGGIHRSQNAECVDATELATTLRFCNTAVGVGVHGAYAALLLWHVGDPHYATMVLKVVSHAQLANEEKALIRFLFQDITGTPLSPENLPPLSGRQNPAFQASLNLYTEPHISTQRWAELQQQLPASLLPYHQIEVSRKSPARVMYREAPTNALFADALFHQNLATLGRYLSTNRWQRLVQSGKAAQFRDWLAAQKIDTVRKALLFISDPEVFEKEDLSQERRRDIVNVLEEQNVRAWLFQGGRMPPLAERRQYFKFFCLFGRHGEAVRCFATLGIFRRDRALRLYYARALFSGDMLHEAWAEMSALLADYPRDAAVLNEAGIYAHKLGRYEEAAQIFATARGMFPDDATIAYNEAVFTEQYSKLQVEAKWSAVQKLTAPPVIEA